MAESQILQLTQQLAALLQSMTSQNLGGAAGSRLNSYDGKAKGLAARQWLLQLRTAVTSSGLNNGAAISLARQHLAGRAATWFHVEDAEMPFSCFESEPAVEKDFS